MSKIRTLLIGTGLAAALLGVPAVVHAAGEFHPGSGEKGVTEHPSHRALNKDRAQVVAERDAAVRAQSQRTAPYGEGWGASADDRTGPGLSRAEVKRETLRAMQAGEISKGER